MRLHLGYVAAAVLALSPAAARADLLIQIDKSIQQMTVSADGETLYTWPVSTGIARYDTPNGAYTPFRKDKDHYSREWDDAPMPYSIFFTKKGHAIHGTNHSGLGHAASHGCVRLSVAHAAVLWDLVAKHKMANTTVVLTGTVPATSNEPAVARAKPRNNDVLRRDAAVLRDVPPDEDNAAVAQNDDQDTVAEPPPARYYYRDRPRYYYYRDYRDRGLFAPRPYYRYGGFPFYPYSR